jgi:hypothetical protein
VPRRNRFYITEGSYDLVIHSAGRRVQVAC